MDLFDSILPSVVTDDFEVYDFSALGPSVQIKLRQAGWLASRGAALFETAPGAFSLREATAAAHASGARILIHREPPPDR